VTWAGAAPPTNAGGPAPFELPKRPGAAILDFLPEILLIAVAAAALVWSGGRYLDPMNDPGTWWSIAERVASGEQIYRDIRLHYGPLSPYLLAGVGAVFGLSARAFLLYNAIPALLLAVLLLRAARPFLGTLERIAVGGLVLGIGVFGSGRARLVMPYAPPAVHGLCFAVAAILVLRRTEAARWQALMAGALSGLAFCAKQEVGVAAIAGCGALSLLRHQALRGWLAPYLAGLLPVTGAAVLFAARMATFEELRYEDHLWPIGTIPQEWKFLARLAMGMTADAPKRVFLAAVGLAIPLAAIGLVGMIAVGDSRIRRPVALGILAALGVAGGVFAAVAPERWDPLCLSMLAAFAVALFALRARGPGDEFLVGFGLFAGIVATRAAFAGRVLWSSYSGIGCVATAVAWGILLFRFGPALFPGGRAASLTRRLTTIAVLAYAVSITAEGIRQLRPPGRVALATRQGVVWPHAGIAAFYEVLQTELHPGERVLAVPESNALEPLYGVRSASAFNALLPGWLDDRAESRVLAASRREPPDAVVLFRRPTPELGVGPLGEDYGRDLVRWIFENYRIVASDPNAFLLRPRRPGAAQAATREALPR
jgi:4-amino-4-deoxy-L-arabinose transferase-like glycosyltransferase